MPRAACLARDRGPLGVTGGKTRCEYMFSELPQIADIVGAVGREDCLKPLFSVEGLAGT